MEFVRRLGGFLMPGGRMGAVGAKPTTVSKYDAWLAVMNSQTPASLWPMQEGSGSTVIATTGTNGTYTGTPSLSGTGPTDALPKCATFNGSTQKFSVPTSFSGSLTTSYTWWAYWDSYATGNKRVLTCPDPYQTGAINGWTICPDGSTGGYLIVQAGKDGMYNARVYSRPTAAAWHHYALVSNRNNTQNPASMTFYVDGSVLSTFTASDNDRQNYAFNGTYIKGFEYGGAYSAGRMAGLAAFNYALTAGQIAAQYAAAL